MAREIGFTYEVKLSAVVTITCPPTTSRAYLRAALLANVLSLIDSMEVDVSEIDDNAKHAGEMLVDSWRVIEKRDLMTGELIGASTL